jgi:hypothetical protein
LTAIQSIGNVFYRSINNNEKEGVWKEERRPQSGHERKKLFSEINELF